MKVCFDVHGENATDLERAALEMLEEFAPGRHWSWEITAQPEIASNERVVMWRGEVEASD